MKKLNFFVDFDKEETWLNQMAAEGHLLSKADMSYTFTPIQPGSAVVRIDHRSSMRRDAFDDYLRLFEDAGWQHLEGSKGGGPQYFASFSDDANADIFSDAASKAQRYRRSIANRLALLIPFLFLIYIAWTLGTGGPSTFASPKDWYLTPELWDLQGAEFVGAFLIETPFVLLRVGGPLFLACACVVLAAQITKQYVLYRRAMALAYDQ